MATMMENLQTRRAAICAELAALSSSTAGGKPNSAQGGIDHIGYKDSLYRELEQIDKLMSSIGGPWVEVSEVTT